jgi:hypothetical protein
MKRFKEVFLFGIYFAIGFAILVSFIFGIICFALLEIPQDMAEVAPAIIRFFSGIGFVVGIGAKLMND